MNHPLLLALLIVAGVYMAKLWRDDLRAHARGEDSRSALPGARPAPRRAVGIAIAGGIVLVALETMGEITLGVSAQQSRMSGLFAVYSIASAPVIEELIFRGWLVIEHRGRMALWAGIVGASALFALLHPFLWQWDSAGFVFTLDAKGWFSSAAAFASSLWFYTVRFAPWNPAHSLLPCFAAHAAKNAAVVTVKAATGYLVAPW